MLIEAFFVLTVEQIVEQVAALRRNNNVEQFEDWFHAAARGYRGPKGIAIFDAVAAVDLVLSAFAIDDIGELDVPQELARVLRPFVAPLPESQGVSVLDLIEQGRMIKQSLHAAQSRQSVSLESPFIDTDSLPLRFTVEPQRVLLLERVASVA